MADEDDFVRITLRLPRELHEKLNDSAAKKRSMNAEIIGRLEGSFYPRAEPAHVRDATPSARRRAMSEELAREIEAIVEKYVPRANEIDAHEAADPGAVIRRANERQAGGER